MLATLSLSCRRKCKSSKTTAIPKQIVLFLFMLEIRIFWGAMTVIVKQIRIAAIVTVNSTAVGRNAITAAMNTMLTASLCLDYWKMCRWAAATSNHIERDKFRCQGVPGAHR